MGTLTTVIQTGLRNLFENSLPENAAAELNEHREDVLKASHKIPLHLYGSLRRDYAQADDLLMAAFHKKTGVWPIGEHLRAYNVSHRPYVLGCPSLPGLDSETLLAMRHEMLAPTDGIPPHLVMQDKHEGNPDLYDAFGAHWLHSRNVSFAAGKERWAPVGIAISLAFGHEWLVAFLQSRLWIHVSSPIWCSWLDANSTLIGQWYEQMNLLPRPFRDVHEDDHCFETASDEAVVTQIMTRTGFQEMAHEYLGIISATHTTPGSPALSFGMSREAVRLSQIAALKSLKLSKIEATHAANEMALSWFEIRGVKVNRRDLLIEIHGYEPLHYSTDCTQ